MMKVRKFKVTQIKDFDSWVAFALIVALAVVLLACG